MSNSNSPKGAGLPSLAAVAFATAVAVVQTLTKWMGQIQEQKTGLKIPV